jgi:hypothetical protein
MSKELDALEASLDRMSTEAELVPLDPFQYGVFQDFLRHARDFIAAMRAQTPAPATLSLPTHKPTRKKEPEPLVFAPGKRRPVKPKGA